MMKIIVGYLVISVLVAVCYLRKEVKYENEMSTVPYGDLEYFEKKESLMDILLYPFFPAMILIALYILVVKVINNLIN